jgi:hypothetical protein
MIKRTLVCIVLCGFMTAGSLLAHHSLAGVYDMKKDMELSGAVERSARPDRTPCTPVTRSR